MRPTNQKSSACRALTWANFSHNGYGSSSTSRDNFEKTMCKGKVDTYRIKKVSTLSSNSERNRTLGRPGTHQFSLLPFLPSQWCRSGQSLSTCASRPCRFTFPHIIIIIIIIISSVVMVIVIIMVIIIVVVAVVVFIIIIITTTIKLDP